MLEYDYTPDTSKVFARLKDLPWPVWLDSAGLGRYDIMSAVPSSMLSSFGPLTRIQTSRHSEWSFEDPLKLLQQQLSSLPGQEQGDLPFTHGAIGYFGYDLGRPYNALPYNQKAGVDMPDMAIGLYGWALVIDHERQRCFLTGHCPDDVLLALKDTSSIGKQAEGYCGSIETNMDFEQYRRAFDRVKEYIHEGDCYQVNLARRFSYHCEADSWSIYQQLRQINPAPYSAYFATPYGDVLSASPEQFLQVRGQRIQTCPIKGTRPRGESPQEDQHYAWELLHSDKDRAENIMIVDLLRNDLGKTCLTGSVKVKELLALKSFATVHHLVSTIEATLPAHLHSLDVLRGCMPGGSITGAPKIRAMQIIDQLENEKRGVYCGSIGYINHTGDADLNIAIRTMVHRNQQATFWAGGGIVADSILEQEYQETLDKARAMFELLQFHLNDG